VDEALASTDLVSATNDVDAAEAAEQYSRLIAVVVNRAIAALPENVRVSAGAELINALIDHLSEGTSKSKAANDAWIS